MSKISVIIISKNEEKRIGATLKSIRWADEIIVVDSKSTDNTVEIAKNFTDKVYFREFDDFSSLKNFAISKCNNGWVFSIDCDEVVSDKLKDAIISAVDSPDGCAAFKVKRINRLFGRILSHTAGSDFPIRLFRKDKARFTQPIHEFLQVKGKVGELEGELLHNSTADLKAEFDKTDRYTELEARWLLERNIRPSVFKMLFYPLLIFLKLYIFKKGMLDGREGLIYAFVSARYSFVKYLKAYRLSKDPRYLEGIIGRRFSELSEQFPDTINEKDSRLNYLLEALGDKDGRCILEIGCGKGRFTDAVSKQRARCIGVDISERFLKEALSKNKGIFLKSSATGLAFRARSFDAAFAVEAIEHIPDLKRCIAEAARILKPDASLIIVDRNILSINNRRLFIPNIVIKKYHEIKNDWMYPRGFPYTEKWFLNGEVTRVLKTYFDRVESSYVISDSEKDSKTAFLFKNIPVSRHFILWKATGPKV